MVAMTMVHLRGEAVVRLPLALSELTSLVSGPTKQRLRLGKYRRPD